MESLEISEIKCSPIKTIEKKESKKYYDLKYLTSDYPLTADQIFKVCKNNNEEIIEKLLETQQDYLEKDNFCPCEALTKKINFFSRKCKGCQIISRLIKEKFLTNNEIEIFYGNEKGKKFLIEKKDYFVSDYTRDFVIEKFYKSLDFFKIDKSTEIYYTENKYYNFVIICNLYNKIMKEEKLNLLNSYIWSFVCGNYLVLFQRSKRLKDIQSLKKNPYFTDCYSPVLGEISENNLSKKTFETIIYQLVIILKTFSNYNFLHSEPNKKFLSFIDEKKEIKIEDKVFYFSFKVTIDLTPESSITYDNKTFSFGTKFLRNYGFPVESIEVDLNGTKGEFKQSQFLEDYSEKRIMFYKIGNKSEIFLKIRKDLGLNLFQKSFEFICFLISVIKDESLFSIFLDKQDILNCWKGLWRLEELKEIEKQLMKTNLDTFEEIFNFIKNYYIRFDAVDYFYKKLIGG